VAWTRAFTQLEVAIVPWKRIRPAQSRAKSTTQNIFTSGRAGHLIEAELHWHAGVSMVKTGATMTLARGCFGIGHVTIRVLCRSSARVGFHLLRASILQIQTESVTYSESNS
jgi:hypothetical protein